MNTENSHTITENGYDNIKILLIYSYNNIKGIVIPDHYAFLSSAEDKRSTI